MSVREYIGARYVPLFGRTGEDSIVWDNTGTYEPLTVVLYQGNSYTSRQYVPIGIDITNTDYWAETGSYNAQVEQYRNEVLSFDNRITTNASAISDVNDALPIADFDDINTVKNYIDDNISNVSADVSTLSDILPASAFSNVNTVKNYIDDDISTLSDILPASAFSNVNTVKNYIDDNISNVSADVSTLSDILPASAFSNVNTVKNYIDSSISESSGKNDFYYMENVDKPYIYIDATNGNDSNGDGTTNSPFASIEKAFDYARNKNWRDINIIINGAGNYYLPERITNAQVHININSGVTAQINIYQTTQTYYYNSYLHFEGNSSNYINLYFTLLHQDVGAIYMRYCNVYFTQLSISWCGITFSSCVIHNQTPSGTNNTFTCCNMFMSSCTYIHEDATGGYMRMYGGYLRFHTSLTIGGNTARTFSSFYLDTGCVCSCNISNINAENNFTRSSYFIHLENALMFYSNAAQTAISTFMNGLYEGRGIVTKTTSVIELT